MLRIQNIAVPLEADEAALRQAAARRLRLPESAIVSVEIVKKSVDARDKNDVHFVLSLDVAVQGEAAVLKRLKPGIAERVMPPRPLTLPKPRFSLRPVVVGAGPAGLFAALTLAQAGARPILLERGRPVAERVADIQRLQERGELNPESNIQFGEGGAGTFSDGKLTTGIKSPLIRRVLKTFVAHGAPEEILILQKPHIGTDLLRQVIVSMREELLRLGGEVRFSCRVTELVLQGSQVAGVRCVQGEEELTLSTDTVLLCVGHSARDTAQALFRQGVRMVQKPFAMGVRIEHPQAWIDQAQYGRFAGHAALRHADYKLNVHTPDGRGVYTFCMCPGGEVVCAASQPGGLAVNGMSLHARDGINANAALLVGVKTADFGDDHPLSGMVLQRAIEQAAFRAGGEGYRAPAQRVGDLLSGHETSRFGEVMPSIRPGAVPADLRACLPDFILRDLCYALPLLGKQLRGFDHPDAVLTGVETRSSSPVRLPRGEDGMAEGIVGLYPAGEGAGYAGGIVSAAVDGIQAAIRAMERSLLL